MQVSTEIALLKFAIWSVALLRNSINQLPTPAIWQCTKSDQGENLILSYCMHEACLF